MASIKIKGYEIAALTIKDSFDRRALQFKNKIITSLKKLGLTDDDIDVDLENAAAKNAPASASWYYDDHYLYFGYKSAPKYVENLYVVFKVIDLEVNNLLSGQKTPQEFINDFSEEKDVKKRQKEARKILGVDEKSVDLNDISTKYKRLAKKYHPDMPDGDNIKFKQINHAHKVLKRELQ